MGAPLAKQYLPLLGKPLIHHSLAALCTMPAVEAVFVVLAPDDEQWGLHDWSSFGHRLRPLFCGGETRAETVLGGLRAVAGQLHDDDWVLVHDAARPCLAPWHLERLLGELAADQVGGLLAAPVADTVKEADAQQRVAATIPRQGLWLAQTPQMFRYRLLHDALERCIDVTDEAAAIEAMGQHPRLIESDGSNLKVTYPIDLELAASILRSRMKEAG